MEGRGGAAGIEEYEGEGTTKLGERGTAKNEEKQEKWSRLTQDNILVSTFWDFLSKKNDHSTPTILG